MLRKNSGQIVVAVILLVTWILAALTGPWTLAFTAAASLCAWVLGGVGLGAGLADKIRAGIAAMVEAAVDRIGEVGEDEPNPPVDEPLPEEEIPDEPGGVPECRHGCAVVMNDSADAPQECEGGCGPAYHLDSEGVPLCCECWDCLPEGADPEETEEPQAGEDTDAADDEEDSEPQF